MTRFFYTICLLGLVLNASALRVAVPADTVTSDKIMVMEPDTLVDLNKQLGGLAEVTVAKGVVIPDAILVTPEGLIILRSPNLLNADAYNFEVKARAEHEEYIISVKVRRSGDKILVTTVADKIDMATGFRAEGKIYVVVAVSLVLFAVLVTFLIILDRRLRRLGARLENKV